MFVVFEGIDGSGKTSLVNRTVDWLEKMLGPSSVIRTKDPGGTQLGLDIRDIMYKSVPTHKMATGVVDLLFLASHIQNWRTLVLPALEKKKIVVCDRWWYSQLAYMSQREVPNAIANAYRNCHGDSADVLIFLHGDVKLLVDRARSRTEEVHQAAKAWNDYEKLGNIQEEYLTQFSTLPEFRAIDVGERSIDQVWQSIKAILSVELAKAGICLT